MTIRYLNTDLELVALHDLSPLAAAFEAQGVVPLHVARGNDTLWYASFETAEQHEEPEPNIAAMLAVVEALTGPAHNDWRACSHRECNIGYDCGNEPWAFNHALSIQLLQRMVEAGVALRITLYPPESASKVLHVNHT